MKRIFALCFFALLVAWGLFWNFFLKSPRSQDALNFKVDKPSFSLDQQVDQTKTIIFLSVDSLFEPYEAVWKEPFSNSLGNLLYLIKKEKPEAVFFVGNLFPEWSESKEQIINPFFYTDRFLNGSQEVKKRIFSDEKIEERIKTFAQFIFSHLGKQIPFYPVMGDVNEQNKKAQESFRQEFHLTNTALIDTNQLVYSVSLEPSFFIVFATNWSDEGVNPEEIEVSDWLKTTLTAKKGEAAYLFTVGNQPIFSSSYSIGKFIGLDRFPSKHKQFWNVLKNNHVTAYFSGKDAVYDRTLRDKVWHIIIGSGNTPTEQKNQSLSPHYLKMKVPNDLKTPPQVQLIDDKGDVLDSFFLTQEKEASIYQFRISTS